MADVRFVCNAVETFDLFKLREWASAEATAKGLAAETSLTVEVRHPDREMDGSCRWCGCRENEVVTVER